MIEFILGALLYARFTKKYNLNKFLKHWSSWIPLFFGFFYIFLEFAMWMGWQLFLPNQHLIKTATLLSYLPLCLKFRLYEDEKGRVITSPMIIATSLLWLGSYLNTIAQTSNSGYMPVFPSLSYWTGYVKPEFIQEGIHILGNAYTNLIPLTDIFDVGFGVLSIGDLLIRLFPFIILYNAIKRSNKIVK